MGGGSWTASDWTDYSSKHITGSAATTFTATKASREYDCRGVKIRESCDSDEHPNSTPIIIGLDVTGSMGRILEVVSKKLGDLAEGILDRNPVTDPQIMFAAIGDSCCDDYPLQVTQFESDIRIAKQLTDLYFERGGGGNNFESYPLAWYFAAQNTAIDCFDKHDRKGFLFTMGDDCYPSVLKKEHLVDLFDADVETDVPVEDVLQMANRKYEVFHLMLQQGGSAGQINPSKWTSLMGERAINVTDYNKIPEIIISILETMAGKPKDEIIASWDGSTALAVSAAISGLSATSKPAGLVKF